MFSYVRCHIYEGQTSFIELIDSSQLQKKSWFTDLFTTQSTARIALYVGFTAIGWLWNGDSDYNCFIDIAFLYIKWLHRVKGWHFLAYNVSFVIFTTRKFVFLECMNSFWLLKSSILLVRKFCNHRHFQAHFLHMNIQS